MGAAEIIGFGAIAVDRLIYVDQPLASGKGKVTQRVTAHGGNVATGLVAAARLGARAGFVGWLNTCEDEDVSALDLLANGVEIRHAPRHAEAQAIQSTITVGSDGERFIAYDDEVMIGTAPDLPDDLLRSAKVLMIDAYAWSDLEVVARAQRLGLPIVADIEWSVGASTSRLLELADHLVLPLSFARQETGCTDPAAVIAALWASDRKAVVLTDGAAGSVLRAAGSAEVLRIPAFDVPVVDTTGAGDCFHGAYAAALARGDAPFAAARFAAAAAALSVTGQGGRAALPDRRAVQQLLAATAPAVATQ